MPAGDTTITGVHHDSRRVTPGGVFVCLPGLTRDGHEFASRARESGAALVIGERESIPNVPYLQVDDGRKALALLAASWYGHPSHRVQAIGITGTNGKSSVTWMIESICRAAGKSGAVMGTLGVGRPGALKPQPFTTPEATEFQAELAALVQAGVEVAAIEVSSHGLELRRTYGTRFPIVVFTNLSQDHLDFHRTMEQYAAAKNRLFRAEERGDPLIADAIVNGDDPSVDAIVRGSGDRIVRYGRSESAQIRATEVRYGSGGLTVEVQFPGGAIAIESKLRGAFQVDNLLAAFGAGLMLGIAPDVIARGLHDLAGVPGRMEPVDAGQEFSVLVDYAHTPDALARALESLRPFTRGRLLLVFGCGGDRDRAKRAEMGKVAAAADLLVLTDDNPRTEDPDRIREEVRRGVPGTAALHEVPDRERAISLAIGLARAEDTVLIAGKGHETVQIRGDRVVAFDDREVARRALEQRRLLEGSSGKGNP
jgi:UDP-N-acetylmuramoyl-L-alanyl-D-glutamate--2,6-diaminopimelate ligase